MVNSLFTSISQPNNNHHIIHARYLFIEQRLDIIHGITNVIEKITNGPIYGCKLKNIFIGGINNNPNATN